MKKRRTLLVALLVCALLVVGVGFAETSTRLSINGSASTSPTDISVYFSSGTITDKTSYVTASPGDLSGTPRSVSFTINGLQKAGDKATVEYTIQNDSDYSVEITTNIPTDSNFKITSDFTSAKTLKPKNAESAEDEYTFTVTVELLKTPDAIAGLSTEYDIIIHATGK